MGGWQRRQLSEWSAATTSKIEVARLKYMLSVNLPQSRLICRLLLPLLADPNQPPFKEVP